MTNQARCDWAQIVIANSQETCLTGGPNRRCSFALLSTRSILGISTFQRLLLASSKSLPIVWQCHLSNRWRILE